MAITNAQQYKQLLAKGGRIGFKGGADASEFGKSGSNVNVSSSGSVSKSKSVSPGGGNSRRGDDGPDDRSSALQTYNTKKATGRLGRQDRMGGELQYKNGVLIDETGRPVDDTFRGGFTGDLTENEKTLEKFIDSKANYPSYTPAYVKFLANLNRRPNRKYFIENVLRAGKIPGVDYSMLGEDEFDIEEAYKNYMSNRLAGKTDAMGNPVQGFSYNNGVLTGNFIDNGGGDNNYVPPVIPEDDTTEEDPTQLLTSRILGSQFDPTFFANEGGRAGFAEGGIMPRLNQLSGSVSSAEQMLQEINQRLESAESSLGSGGGGTLANMSNANFNTSNVNLGQLPFQADKRDYNATTKNFFQGNATLPKAEDLRGGSLNQFTPNIDQLNVTPPQTPVAMQSPLQTALGLADGGRAGFAEGGMPYEGGIMDLESGRQMYFLGKLVKKATRAVKKIAKSPIGKAALMYFGGNALMGKMGGLGGLKGSLFGTAGGTARMTPGILGKLGLTGGGGSMGLTGLGKAALVGIPSIIPLLAGKEEDGFDIDAYYAANQLTPGTTKRQMGSEFDFYNYNLAEGGMPSKEPVAKETMPLIDMDGKEMDLRAEGGFVPIGRMERADDVPARLSKNEFVFTADAVRNAGEGDIDKGAEVMYNMMKNLESGGEVSEESQGLDGAREMFQTSKRLEEVL